MDLWHAACDAHPLNMILMRAKLAYIRTNEAIGNRQKLSDVLVFMGAMQVKIKELTWALSQAKVDSVCYGKDRNDILIKILTCIQIQVIQRSFGSLGPVFAGYIASMPLFNVRPNMYITG